MPSEKILVTGASGGLGHAVVESLGRVADVVGVGRSSLSTVPAGLRDFVCVDVADAPWDRLLAGCSAVVHLAAYVHKGVENAADVAELNRTNVEATAALAQACRMAAVKLILASSVSVYGETRGPLPLSEDAPLCPSTPYGRSKLLAEEAVRSEEKLGLRYTILRFPLLFGPRGRGNMERMLRAIARGRYWPVGDRDTPKSCLYFADAAKAITLAACGSRADQGTFNVSPLASPTLGDIHAAAYAAVGKRMPPHVPEGAALAAARAADWALLRIGARPFLQRAVRTLTSPSVFDGRRFEACVGFRQSTELADAMRITAESVLSGGRR